MSKTKIISIFAAAALTLSSCGMIKPIGVDDTQAPIDSGISSVKDTVQNAPSTDEASTDPVIDTEEPSNGFDPGEFETNTQPVEIEDFSDEYNTFLSRTVFIGDSICSGLRVYGILPDDNVMAVPSVAARSIFDYEFTAYGADYGIVDAIKLLKPQFIVFSMGMNDLNTGSEERFTQCYDEVIDTIREAAPDATIFAASITPLASTATYAPNSRIDSFNDALSTMLSTADCTYLDVASVLKDENGNLSDEYDGGDGIHLSPAAYKLFLRRVCELVVG